MASKEGQDWLRFAKDDLETAEFLLGMTPRKIEIICYHCQQCAEKALKAIPAFFDEAIPRSHDLGSILKQCTLHFPELNCLSGTLPKLQPFAVAVRYPYEIEVLAGDEDIAISIARSVLEMVSQVIKESQEEIDSSVS